MMKILIEDVRLTVRIGNTMGNKIITNIGVPQGDCLSPILFIIYLAEALRGTEHIAKPTHTQDHSYAKYNINPLLIDQQYADDIGYGTNAKEMAVKIKKEIPPILKEKNLLINDSKTEQHEID